MSEVTMKPGDVQVALDRDQGEFLYFWLNEHNEKSPSMLDAAISLVRKMEDAGFALTITGRQRTVSFSRVKSMFSLVITKKERQVLKNLFVILKTPGNPAINIAILRLRIDPLLEAFDMLRLVNKEVREGDKKDEEDEILTDAELAEEEAEEAAEKARKEAERKAAGGKKDEDLLEKK